MDASSVQLTCDVSVQAFFSEREYTDREEKEKGGKVILTIPPGKVGR